MALNWFKNKTLSDEEIVLQYKASGNMDILAQLYHSHMHLVYGVCLKYLKNRNDAQDAVMEIFEKLTVELQHTEVLRFKPWLHTVTRNHCLMALRKQQSERRKEQDYQKSEQEIMELHGDIHLNNGWEPEPMDQRLQECLKQLRDQQRQCIELFYFDDLSYKVISEQLALDLKKVKSYIQNGKRNLKNCIESKHVEG